MRRFEFVEGTSSKFWEVQVEDKTVTVRYGRIGAAGTAKPKEFASVEKAKAEAAFQSVLSYNPDHSRAKEALKKL